MLSDETPQADGSAEDGGSTGDAPQVLGVERSIDHEAVLDRIMGDVEEMARRHGVAHILQLGSREVRRKIMMDLDEAYARKLRRRARRVVFATGRRSQRKRGPSLGVGEAYCPERLTDVASEFGLEQKFALDLTVIDPVDGEHWDFEQPWIQEKAIKRVVDDDPGVLLVSPICSPFCTLQQWNHPRMQVERIHQELDHGLRQFTFALLLCILQHRRGIYFILEQPASAVSWKTSVADVLLSLPRVERVTFDFCMAGMRSSGPDGTGPVKKRTAVATNSEAIAATLSKLQCNGGHRHVPLTHGRPKACERYPFDFCRILCEGYDRQISLDKARDGSGHIGGNL